ncbi:MULTISPECIES: hypothetical protein [unclassified Ruminococcus]|uniref:hypothetical protein n=1 Tax=unclassified Ruminococcus TaxID=2608920 RepID=UPI00319E23FC
MRLTGVRTVLHITEVNETERELLKRLGFQNLQETDMADNELWEYCTDFNVSKKIDYQQIGENLIIASDGKIFLRIENGFYIDGNRNEYRFTAGTLIPVLIQNTQPTYPEITDAEYHDEFGKEKAYWDYEVKLDSNRYVTVRVTEASGKIETVENEDGLKVYDYDGRYIVNYPYQEKDVLSVVSARYNKKEKGFGQEL